MPNYVRYEADHAYFFDVDWVLLIPFHMMMHDYLFLFFSSNPLLSPQSILILTLLFFFVATFLTVSLKIYVHPFDGSIICICGFKSKDRRFCFLSCGGILYSFLSPSYVFHYSYPVIFLLTVYPSLSMQPLIDYFLCDIPMVITITSQPKPEHEWNLLDHTLLTLFDYELRWIFFMFINVFLRPHAVSLFSSDLIIISPHNFLKNFLLISIITILFLFVSLKLCLMEDDNRFLFIVLRLDYRHRCSPLIVVVFIFSILCPTQTFLVAIPFIPFIGLCAYIPLHILHNLLLRVKAAVTTFLACAVHVIPSPEPYSNGEDDSAQLV